MKRLYVFHYFGIAIAQSVAIIATSDDEACDLFAAILDAEKPCVIAMCEYPLDVGTSLYARGLEITVDQ